MNLSDEESGGSETDESDAVCPKCGVLYSTDHKGLVVMDVVLGTMLNAHILKEKGNFLRIIFVRTVCKLKFKVLVVHVSICGSLYNCVL